LLLDKPRLLQILVNLIANARQAMATMVREAHLTLGIDISDDGRRLTIRVTDEGEGIPQENLTRIFSHGFTTRKNGHGFGLHSCILTAKAMGGSLIASSDGPGLGATFTLELPMRLADVN
jgi:signal transduction histidine kinase